MTFHSLTMLGLSALLLSGCARYGGKLQPVSLESEPTGATVYTLTYKQWLAHGAKDVLAQHHILEDFRIKEGPTPIGVRLPPYEHVLIADWDGHKEFIRFIPRSKSVVRISSHKSSEK